MRSVSSTFWTPELSLLMFAANSLNWTKASRGERAPELPGAARSTLSAFDVDGQARKKTRKLIHLIRTEHGLDLLIVPDQDVTKMQ